MHKVNQRSLSIFYRSPLQSVLYIKLYLTKRANKRLFYDSPTDSHVVHKSHPHDGIFSAVTGGP